MPWMTAIMGDFLWTSIIVCEWNATVWIGIWKDESAKLLKSEEEGKIPYNFE